MTTRLGSTRWAPLLALTALLSACGAAVSPPEPAATPEPAAPQASCDDAAIRLPDRGAGVHGAIVADTLHMGGATAPATCTEPTNESLEAGLPLPDGRTEQAQQSRYYLIVIRYPGSNRLYIVTRRGDGTNCVVDLNDECIAQVTDLPDDFDLEELPDDAPPAIPGGRPAPPTVSPPPAPSEPATPSEPAAPAAAAPRAAWLPEPSDEATNVAVHSNGVNLIWEPGDSGGRGGPPATSYDVYWGTTQSLAADADLGTPIRTTTLMVGIRPLAFGTTYYWRVDANNAAGATRGNVWSFTTRTASAPPPAPLPTKARRADGPQPHNWATNVELETLDSVHPWFHLGWRPVYGADGYHLYVGTSRDLASDDTVASWAPYSGKTYYYEETDFFRPERPTTGGWT